jgi:hypothetical protein
MRDESKFFIHTKHYNSVFNTLSNQIGAALFPQFSKKYNKNRLIYGINKLCGKRCFFVDILFEQNNPLLTDNFLNNIPYRH